MRKQSKTRGGAAARWTSLFLGLGIVWASVMTLSAAPSSAAPTPVIQVTPGTVSPGASVTVTGAGFPPNTDIQAQVCGNKALNGSSDCVLSTSQEVATTKKGLFQVPVIVTIPPKPCPCVILVIDFSAPTAPTTPITIVGAPVATPSTVKVHKLQVLNAYLTGDGPWTAWFGAPPQRTLVLTVRNPNSGPYVNPPLVLAIGNTSDTTTHEATQRNLSTIGAYATKIYSVPVSFPAVSIGEHQIVGRVGNAGLSKTFVVKTWLFPWGLLVVILLLLELILLATTRYFRERRRRREEAEAAAAAAAALQEGDFAPPTGEVPLVGAAVGAAAAGAMGANGAASDPPAAPAAAPEAPAPAPEAPVAAPPAPAQPPHPPVL